MDTKQAHAVKVGQRVFYQADATVPQAGEFGTVSKKEGLGFTVAWDDETTNGYPYVHADFIHKVGYMGRCRPEGKGRIRFRPRS